MPPMIMAIVIGFFFLLMVLSFNAALPGSC